MNLDEAVAKILELGGEKVKFIIFFGSRAGGKPEKTATTISAFITMGTEGRPSGSGCSFWKPSGRI